MRGGTQANLVEADDGEFYVVKVSNNPQGRRVLVSDAIGSILLRSLGISAPEPALVTVTPEFLQQNPNVSVQLGQHRKPVEPGVHFGSRYPGHPDRLAVFDLLPDQLLAGVKNLAEFLGALVFDKWVGNADRRQAVFFRSPCDSSEPGQAQCPPFRALMIDHGLVFGGLYWDFATGPLHGLCFSERVYEGVRSLRDFEPWLERVALFPEAVIERLRSCVPEQWMDGGDEPELERVLETLVRRRERVAELIRDCRIAKPTLFPNWKGRPTKALGRLSRHPPSAMAV